MNKIISLYRDAVRDDWDKQTDATLANMQEAEQNILSRLAAGEEAVKKVAELEKEIKEWENSRDGFLLSSQAKNFKIMELEKEAKRKADLFAKKCFECDEFERQAAAGQRAVDAMEQNILSIVDACFHAFASSFRNDAKEMAEDLIKTIIQQSKEAL